LAIARTFGSGILAGLASLVVRKDGQVRVVISIDSIMRSFAVVVRQNGSAF